MEETIVESPYCMDLAPVSRQRFQQLIKYFGHDMYFLKMNGFSTEPKYFPIYRGCRYPKLAGPSNVLLHQTAHESLLKSEDV